MKAINLSTEYLINPIGIDIAHPRLFWNDEGNKKQKGFRIEFKKAGEVIFDTGKVISSLMHYDVPFPLASRDEITWGITLFDEEDKPSEEGSASFEMGLLNKSDFLARWIKGDYAAKKNKRYPVDCFKKAFYVDDVSKARLYISACGLYEAKINDVRVGEFVLAPGSTDYRKRIQYQTYDVTRLLKKGENEITVELADGWYRGSSGAKGRTNTYGKETKLFAQLEIRNSKGEMDTMISDSSWNWSNDGPIEFADLKDGERVDANKTPTYKNHAKEVRFAANLTSSNNVIVKEHEHFKPLEIIMTPSHKTVLKFPQNLSGYLSFRLLAHKGQKIHIELGEMLGKDGEFTLENVQCIHKGKRSPLQSFDYICKEGVNEYKPKYFYGGFQYALVETDIPFEKDDFTAIAVYSDFQETSSFSCSNELINQFYKNTLWSLKSNSTDLPSDCPTRERMGWTGDSQLFFNAASYLTNYASFARKHVKDIYDRQWRSGRPPQIAPFANEDWFMWVMNGSVGWACAGVYIPYYFYKRYGDERILNEYYEGMLHYAKFMIKRAGKWGGIYAKPIHLSLKNRRYAVNCEQSYGEWAEPNDVCAFQWYDFASPHPEESTAYTYFTLKHVLLIASILGKKEDKELKRIKKYSEGAKRAYQELVTKKKYSLDTDRQAKLVRPLYMGLLNEEQTKFATERLLEAMDHYSWRLGTGFLSTPFILDVLASINPEYAFKLLKNEECPGWLYMVKQGATTIWESWEGNCTSDKGIASLNHYSKGALCEWLIGSLCGIKTTGEQNQFLIKPLAGGDLTYANASYQSIYGLVKSGWRKEEGKTSFHVEIPSNCEADIVLPNGLTKKVSSGIYDFEI